MSDELRRIETLERLVRHLTRELAELRDDVRASREQSPAPDATREQVREQVREPVRTPVREPALQAVPDASRADAHAHPTPFASSRRESPSQTHDRASASLREISGRVTESLDLERLVGRYGTVALAVVTIVMGVGAFLRWAIEHVQVGPVQRVVAGAVVALGIGLFGWRLRSRGARQYGDMLVGLSLALVHVVAWGAGPYLQVIPDKAALVVAAAASVLLAMLAWHEREQPLFAAGLGGAFLAPFVTMRATGVPELLLGYATPIVVSGTLALRRGDWRVARRILAMGTLLVAATALATLTDRTAWWRLAEGPAFALAAAVCAQLLAGEGHRRALAYTDLGSALLVLMAFVSSGPPVHVMTTLCLAGALVAAVASQGEGDAASGTFELALSSTGTFLVATPDAEPVPWVGAVGFPLAFMAVALVALHDPITREGGMVAGAFALLALVLAAWRWTSGAARRGAHLATAGAATVVALVLAMYSTPVPLVVALVVTSAVATGVAARTATPLALAPGLLALVIATATAIIELMDRPAWAYVPFATAASLAGLVSVVGWFVAARDTKALARACAKEEPATSATLATLRAESRVEQRAEPRTMARRATGDEDVPLRAVAYLVAFAWGHEELRHAFSPALATFLLVAYYAVTGVVTIGVGRVRASSAARKVGLALSVLAGLKALVEASSIPAIGLRVGSYLLVGVFLLGVAWWYRSGAGDVTSGATRGEPAPDPVREPAHDPARAVHNAG